MIINRKAFPNGKAFFIAAICGRKIVLPWVVARVVLSLLMHPTPETIARAKEKVEQALYHYDKYFAKDVFAQLVGIDLPLPHMTLLFHHFY